MAFKKINIKKILVAMLWISIGAATIVLSVAAMKRQDETVCKGVEAEIHGVSNNFFIDKKDIEKIVNDYLGKNAKGTPIAGFNLREIENVIEKDVWVDNAELYFDRNGVLQVNVEEREPVARVFTRGGNTFYIDSATTMLPLSEKFSARLPVFTGFPSEARVLRAADSVLLSDIKRISIAIQKDSFLMAMIDQVDITAEKTFEIIPKLGEQQIVFGDGTDIEAKFKKLKMFYRDVITKSGWSKYSIINLQYKDQVVAKLKGKEDVAQDSLKTLQMMSYMAINAAIQAADSLKVAAPGNDNNGVDLSLIQQSVQRDDEGVEGENSPAPTIQVKDAAPFINKPVPAPAVQPVVVKPVVRPATKPAVKKPVVSKPATKPAVKKPIATPKQKPKAVMPKNDY